MCGGVKGCDMYLDGGRVGTKWSKKADIFVLQWELMGDTTKLRIMNSWGEG